MLPPGVTARAPARCRCGRVVRGAVSQPRGRGFEPHSCHFLSIFLLSFLIHFEVRWLLRGGFWIFLAFFLGSAGCQAGDFEAHQLSRGGFRVFLHFFHILRFSHF